MLFTIGLLAELNHSLTGLFISQVGSKFLATMLVEGISCRKCSIEPGHGSLLLLSAVNLWVTAIVGVEKVPPRISVHKFKDSHSHLEHLHKEIHDHYISIDIHNLYMFIVIHDHNDSKTMDKSTLNLCIISCNGCEFCTGWIFEKVLGFVLAQWTFFSHCL